MDLSAICLCALCYFVSAEFYPENCTLTRMSYTIRLLRPSCLLSQINTHVHIAPTPWGTAGVSSRGLWQREKKAFRRTVICFSSAIDHGQAKKTSSFSPPKSLFGSACQKTGLGSFMKGRQAGRQQILLSVCMAKKWAHLAKAAMVNSGL